MATPSEPAPAARLSQDVAEVPASHSSQPSLASTPLLPTLSKATTHNFSSALSTWKEINLTELQRTLDARGLEIVENQKENMVGRKRLAEQTREFRKVPDEEKATSFKGLLKAYQAEIDMLTKRSKIAETAFLHVYKLLAEAPDPFPLLDAAVDQTAKASEARVLELSLKRAQDEAATLKAQLAEAQASDKERRKLAERAEKLEKKMDDTVNEKVTQKEAELHAIYDERLRNYQERERDLERQATMARAQLHDLRSSNDTTQAQLMSHSSRRDQESQARSAEIELINADLERATARAAEVERRNEKLRAEIEALRLGSESDAKLKNLELQLEETQSETSRLLKSLDSQKEEAARAADLSLVRLEAGQMERAALEAEIETLRQRLASHDDYDEVKRELEIMKFVEFSSLNDEDFNDAGSMISSMEMRLPNPNADKPGASKARPLEQLLMLKNRKLSDQVTALRVAHEDLGSSERALQTELVEAQTRFEEERALNARLEADLARVNGSNSNDAEPRLSTGNGHATEEPLASLSLGKRTGTPTVNGSTAETSILPIITSQRDRFRQRNTELEEELRRQFATISELRSELKTLQADNLKLYEKVRYLQSYKEDAGASRTGLASILHPKRDEELGKYRERYENTINPFEAFRGREQSRAIQALNPIEKILFGLSRRVLTHRLSRALFVAYAIALHLVALSALYGYSETTATVIRPPDDMSV
ncbi:uncharacterized protein L969DRAFT_105582 [Mixia osmundae IAM 14324]|uniref:Protein CASP n=1 Tax=Mixia osmundae (strain CBS 9802 / IAM 14324 / JCM 22182 / KY 12970) TaxID=764103 RepID=G7E2F9_MIXOS|nr:uncharacterized protein L969DRAFT_105582 [Mixia osmundae IAM 14324]KEI36889.1 hypothetical protein L969DRAFT_105582 [Mixia osmundae IAM 14324]GAA97019.1 hypothetical protein E5Q_03694 [Mixia osmundae IAM 14324]